MRRTLVTSLVLAFSVSALGGQVLAQTDDPSPSPTAAAIDVAEQGVGTPNRSVRFTAPTWRRITPGRGPAAREDHTWTVDSEGRFAYLFGGRDGAREFGDTWRYDLRHDAWRRISVKGNSPAPRFGHNAVWVEGMGLVVFAGQQGTSFFDDLWVLDPDRSRWRKLPSRGQVPKSRYGSCMVLGPDGRLWISHGFTDSGRFDDTRSYNLRTQRWAVITPDGRKPGERCLHDCFTSLAGDLVLYGGQDDGNFALGDLWSMGRERTWVHHDDPQAKPRRLYGVTEAGDVAYIFGGAGEDNAKLADLWLVDRETLQFERLRSSDDHPAGRSAPTLITDGKRGRLLLFGGQSDSGARSDVWELVETAELAETMEPDPQADSAEDTPQSAATDAMGADETVAPETAATETVEEPADS